MSRFVHIADGLHIPMELKRIRDESRRGPGEYAPVEIDWQKISPYVVDNGLVKIFPLARSAGGEEADTQMSALRGELERHFIHFFGGDWFHAETPLNLEEGYGKKIADLGLVAPPRYVWSVATFAFTMVHAVDHDQPGASTLALHIYPGDWQWPPRHKSDTKKMRAWRWENRGRNIPEPKDSTERTQEKRMNEASIEWHWPTEAKAIEKSP